MTFVRPAVFGGVRLCAAHCYERFTGPFVTWEA